MLEQARTDSQKYWDAISEKLALILNEHAELRHILSQLPSKEGLDET